MCEKEQIADIIEAYLDIEKQEQAEQIKNRLWSEFTETEYNQENTLVFRYMINQYMYSPFHKDILFEVMGKYGNYFYAKADWWTLEKAMDNASAGESSIKYIKDCFSYPYDERIPVFYIPHDGTSVSSGQQTDGVNIRIRVTELYEPIGIAHEVVHLMLRACELSTKGFYTNGQYDVVSQYYLQEGLCEYLNGLFFMNTDNAMVFENVSEYIPVYIHRSYGKKYYDKYLFIRDTKANKNDAVALADLMALKAVDEIRTTNKNSVEKITDYILSESIISFLNFVFKQNENKQTFIEFYQDPAQVEALYGKGLNELIDEWLEYLDISYKDIP